MGSGIPSSFIWNARGGRTLSIDADSVFASLLGSCCGDSCERSAPLFCSSGNVSEQVGSSLRSSVSPSFRNDLRELKKETSVNYTFVTTCTIRHPYPRA